MEEQSTQSVVRWSIKAMRVNRRMTLKEAAEKLCISIPTLSKLERGERQITLNMAQRMSELYGISLDLFE